MDLLTTTQRHTLPDGELVLVGAWRTVTGAMTLLDAGGRKVLFDCGVAQGEEARGWSVPDEAHEADVIVLTHGHNDHVGSLPVLLDRRERPVYGTAATLEIARIVLEDGVRLAGGSDADVRRLLGRLERCAKTVPYGSAWAPEGFAGTLALREAGHILGSASVEVGTEGSRVIVSGDLGRPDSPILRDPHRTWSADRPVDLVVMESTYGDSEHRESPEEVTDKLLAILERALKDGGHVLIPAFAIGRVQTLLHHLNALVESGRLPHVPVALDTPMGLRITETYEQFRSLFDREAMARIANGDDPLDFDSLYAVRRASDSVRLRDVKTPMIVIAGSGMCTGGRIVGHLQELLPDPKTCVLFVGYQAAGTPGRRIQEAGRRGGTVWLEGEDVPVRAHIETLSGLSAHADRRELRGWLEAIPNVRRVALHHGEPEAQRAFASWIQG